MISPECSQATIIYSVGSVHLFERGNHLVSCNSVLQGISTNYTRIGHNYGCSLDPETMRTSRMKTGNLTIRPHYTSLT